MICTLDANAIISWSDPKCNPLILAKLELLFETVHKDRGVILLPTPALAELLVLTNNATADWLNALQKRSAVRIAPFDLKAATECALIHRLADDKGGKRKGTKKGEAYQKIKVDRQIAAIARVHQSDLIVTNDENLAAISKFIGLRSLRIEELDTPDSAKQTTIFQIENPV